MADPVQPTTSWRRLICRVVGHDTHGTLWRDAVGKWEREIRCLRCGRVEVQRTTTLRRPLDVFDGRAFDA